MPGAHDAPALEGNPECAVEAADLAKGLSESMTYLRPRDREVLQMRYQLDLTVGEVAMALKVSPARAGQIERQALRNMRHPSMVGMFIDSIAPVDAEYRATCINGAAALRALRANRIDVTSVDANHPQEIAHDHR